MNAFLGADLAHVDHAFHPVRKLYERAEFGEAGNRSFDCRARRKFSLDLGPGVAQRLLEAQGEAAFAIFTPRTTASTVSPVLSTSLGFLTFLAHDISDKWINPSTPGSSSTNAPKSVTRVTTPCTRSPAFKLAATASQG